MFGFGTKPFRYYCWHFIKPYWPAFGGVNFNLAIFFFSLWWNLKMSADVIEWWRRVCQIAHFHFRINVSVHLNAMNYTTYTIWFSIKSNLPFYTYHSLFTAQHSLLFSGLSFVGARRALKSIFYCSEQMAHHFDVRFISFVFFFFGLTRCLFVHGCEVCVGYRF